MKSSICKKICGGIVWVMSFAVASIVVMACSGSDDKSVAGGTTDDAGIVAVKDLNVAGVTQKGPFAKGSAVTVRGIDCKTMKFTDEIFEGEVKSDKGDFAVEGVTLKSTCAVLEVTGQYLNELSGKKSSEKITLRVLTDLENRKTVNVNVLTELEYGRAKYLVTEKKKPVADAKKRAGKEVLAAFGIEGDFGSSEDLTIFEGGDGNAALLAVSVLMQAETDEAGLTKRMDKFVDSFEETGKWNDDETKAAIDGWRVSATADGTLDSIRKSVDGWEYADEVPPFEKYIELFGDSVVLADEEDVDEGSSSSGKGKSGDESVKSSSSSGAKTPSSGKDSSVTTSSSGEGKSSSSSKSSSSVASSSSLFFSTGCPTCEYGTLTDERDGQTYRTVVIGSQTWMAENLNYDYDDKVYWGDYFCKNGVCNDAVAAHYVDYENYETYGRLYLWKIAMDSAGLFSADGLGCGDDCGCSASGNVRGVCPEGWHLPSKSEFETLIATVGGEEVLADKLKSTSGWDNGNGTDDYGFSGLPSGYCYPADGVGGFGNDACYWSSTDESDTAYFNGKLLVADKTLAYYLTLRNDEYALRAEIKWFGCSVRCIKD